MVYKVLNGYDSSLEHLFQVDDNSIIRGQNLQLKKSLFKTTICQHFFNNRVVNNWNSLRFDVVNTTSINSFKISLINVGKIGCMSRENYKQTICFSSLVLKFFHLLLFPKRLLIDLHRFNFFPVQG